MQIRLSLEVGRITDAFVTEVAEILGQKLYGIYMYGASVFQDGGPVQDIDCTVILKSSLIEAEHASIVSLHRRLGERFPPLGAELDAYFILLDDARRSGAPAHQLDPAVFDTAWALHCAHVRAGRFVTLWGPEPTDLFPAPTWDRVRSDLAYQLEYIKDHPQYPSYGVLNLCRILYSFRERDPVVSKHASGLWAVRQFPGYRPLIEAAMRSYGKKSERGDDELLQEGLTGFLKFAEDRIKDLDPLG
ncbi:MAG: DUF4111 domain-containing protein [Planctomycetes bacterium]|nr:DUF4111 domain-containing protein [Planctomycetota bacterium]